MDDVCGPRRGSHEGFSENKATRTTADAGVIYAAAAADAGALAGFPVRPKLNLTGAELPDVFDEAGSAGLLNENEVEGWDAGAAEAAAPPVPADAAFPAKPPIRDSSEPPEDGTA